MKQKILFISLTLIVIILGGFSFSLFKNTGSGGKNEPECVVKEKVIMEMGDLSYAPQNITIPRCSQVTFINKSTEDRWPASNIHPTHGIYPEFDPQHPIKPGEEWSFVFDRAGNWRYHDHLLPTIRGIISVQ